MFPEQKPDYLRYLFSNKFRFLNAFYHHFVRAVETNPKFTAFVRQSKSNGWWSIIAPPNDVMYPRFFGNFKIFSTVVFLCVL